MKLFRALAPVALIGSLFASGEAHALSCDEIMNMVSVNVPTHIVVQTMEDSGETFSADEIRCLVNQGAPQEVVQTAKKMGAKAEDSEPVRAAEPEKQRPSRDDRDDFDDEEELGADSRSSRNQYQDLPEEGQGRPLSKSDCERQVDDAVDALKARKPLGASKMLFDLLEDGGCQGQTTRIHYYLGRALYELKLYHSAQYYFLQVIRKGPANPYFKHALPRLVTISRYTGDNSDLVRIIAKIPPEEYPRKSRNYLYYLMGVRLYDQDSLAEARQYFSQISTKSDVYLKSKYFEGVIYNKQGRLKSAVKSFRDVMRDAETVDIYSDRELREVEDLTDLSLMNIARIYYGIQRFDEATKYYKLVPRDSTYWPQSLFEQSWGLFMTNQLNEALGMVLTVNSPFYSADEFLPETQILRALTFFNLCEYDQVETELLAFEDQLRPIYDELKAFTGKYRSKEGRKLADQAFDTYFTDWPDESILPTSMFTQFLRNADLAGLVRHLELMEEELATIDAQKALWRDSVGAHLKQVIQQDLTRYKRRAGLVMLSEMARTANYVGDLLTQSEIIRFEVVSAQRADYAYKMSNPDLVDTTSSTDLDFATAVDLTYWPFNGEFWEDELGYYHYTEQGACR